MIVSNKGISNLILFTSIFTLSGAAHAQVGASNGEQFVESVLAQTRPNNPGECLVAGLYDESPFKTGSGRLTLDFETAQGRTPDFKQFSIDFNYGVPYRLQGSHMAFIWDLASAANSGSRRANLNDAEARIVQIVQAIGRSNRFCNPSKGISVAIQTYGFGGTRTKRIQIGQ